MRGKWDDRAVRGQPGTGRSISYGLSSYGYDIRVAPDFKVFTNVHNIVVDPKNFDDRSFVDVHAKACIIPSEFIRAGADRGVLPYSSGYAGPVRL